jgi:hypothetical protein
MLKGPIDAAESLAESGAKVMEESPPYLDGMEYTRVNLGEGVEINYPRNLPPEKLEKVRVIIGYSRKLLRER